MLDDARDLARQAESGIDLRLEWAAGDLYPLLLDAARGASAVVVGEGYAADHSRERIAQWLRRNPTCPVICVPARHDVPAIRR